MFLDQRSSWKYSSASDLGQAQCKRISNNVGWAGLSCGAEELPVCLARGAQSRLALAEIYKQASTYALWIDLLIQRCDFSGKPNPCCTSARWFRQNKSEEICSDKTKVNPNFFRKLKMNLNFWRKSVTHFSSPPLSLSLLKPWHLPTLAGTERLFSDFLPVFK